MKKPICIVLVITLAVLTIICTVGFTFPTNIYSPGDLSKYHQGIKNCRQCHIPFKGATSRMCMSSDCHTTDRLSHLSIKSLSDLHISYVNENKDCLGCHIEHREDNFVHQN